MISDYRTRTNFVLKIIRSPKTRSGNSIFHERSHVRFYRRRSSWPPPRSVVPPFAELPRQRGRANGRRVVVPGLRLSDFVRYVQRYLAAKPGRPSEGAERQRHHGTDDGTPRGLCPGTADVQFVRCRYRTTANVSTTVAVPPKSLRPTHTLTAHGPCVDPAGK